MQRSTEPHESDRGSPDQPRPLTYVELAGLRGEVEALRDEVSRLRAGAGSDSGSASSPTPHEATAQALRDSEQRLAQLIEQCPIAVIEWDTDFCVIEWNAAAERTFGHAREDILGQHARVIVPESAWPMVGQVWEELTSCTGGMRSRNENVHADGSMILCEWYNGPRFDEQGRVVAVISLADDVTERVRVEEARHRLERRMLEAAKLESLGVLAGGIAHDFNNLLVGILGSASLALLDMSRDDPARRHLELIDRTAQRAAELTRQMLAYSGKGRFLVEPVSLSRLVDDMAPLLAASVAKSAELTYALDVGLPTIDGDVTQLRQVIMNVILNAADALDGRRGTVNVRTGVLEERPEVSVQLRCATENDPGPYVFVEVQDSGAGMDEETKARVFDPFFTTKAKGHGLGLAAVLGIVRGHNGFITVDSEPGAGTTFVVGLPVGAEHPARREPPAARTAHNRQSATVVVIDDEPAVREVVAEMLRDEGCSTLVAGDGDQGLALIAANLPSVDLVLLDLSMPGGSGDEVYARIAEIAPDVPVVLMSGHAETEVIERFAEAPIAGFVQKPFRAAQLLDVLRRALR